MDLLGRASTQAEFERFVAEHANSLLRTAYLATWELQEAEDLTQETLLRVARRWPRVRRMRHPQAYARRMLANLALDGSRGRGLRAHELGGEDGLGGGSGSLPEPISEESLSLALVGEREQLFAALTTLSQRQRLVLALRYFADLSEEQTARTLGCSVGTVKSTASRALARLREQIDSQMAAQPDCTPHPTSIEGEIR